MNVARWCYKWIGYGMDWIGWYPGGVKYRAPYGAKKCDGHIERQPRTSLLDV